MGGSANCTRYFLCAVVYHSKLEFCVRSKLESWRRSEDGGVKEDDGRAIFCWLGFEEVDVPIGTEAADEGGARRCVHGETEVADGDFAIVADADR